MATATAATRSNRSNPNKEEASSDNAADVRAAALAVLRLADKRTSGGGTAAKHRSPVPTLSPARRPAPSKQRASAPPVAGSSSASVSNGSSSTGGGSFSLMQSFRNQVNEARESMHRLDEKFLTMQFEQEEKIRKAFDRTSSQWSGAISSSSSSSPRNNDDDDHQSAQQQKQQQQRPPDGQSAILSRFRSSFQGFTQSARRQLNLLPQQQRGSGAEPPPQRQQYASMDEAIVAELERLHEKMTLCHSLLAARDEERSKAEKKKKGSYEPDPKLPKTIKFLESCLGRMDQLMEAGIDGQFQEDTTQICVSTYERLILTLEKCNSPLVKSNAFAFTEDLEGDAEYDEVTPPPTPDRPGRAAAAADSDDAADAAAKPGAEPDLALDGLDAELDIDLDAELDIDLAAFEIGSDHDEEDIILNVTDDNDNRREEEGVGGTTPANESSASDDDFIKDMFE